jgi:hypothetical protein
MSPQGGDHLTPIFYASNCRLQDKVKIMWRPTVNRAVCLGFNHLSRAEDQISVTVRQLMVIDVGRHIWREHRSAVLPSPGSWSSLYSLGKDCTENTVSSSSSIVGWYCYQCGPQIKHRSSFACAVGFTLKSYLPCRQLVTALFSYNLIIYHIPLYTVVTRI